MLFYLIKKYICMYIYLEMSVLEKLYVQDTLWPTNVRGFNGTINFDGHSISSAQWQYLHNQDQSVSRQANLFVTAATVSDSYRFGNDANTKFYLATAVTDNDTPWTLTLPQVSGTAGYVLTTDGNGVTTWESASSVSGQPLAPSDSVSFNTVTLGNQADSYVTIQSGSTANWTLTLPPNQGMEDYILKTQGDGTTVWQSPAAIFGTDYVRNASALFSNLNTKDGIIGLQFDRPYTSNSFSGLRVFRDDHAIKEFLFSETDQWWSVGGYQVTNGTLTYGYNTEFPDTQKFRLAECGDAVQTLGCMPGYDANGRLMVENGLDKAHVDNLRLYGETMQDVAVSASPTFTGLSVNNPYLLLNAGQTPGENAGFKVNRLDGSQVALAFNEQGSQPAPYWAVGDSSGSLGTSKFRLAEYGDADQSEGYVPGYDALGRLVVAAGFTPSEVANLKAGTPAFSEGVKVGFTTVSSAAMSDVSFVFPSAAGTADYILKTNAEGVTEWEDPSAIFSLDSVKGTDVQFANFVQSGNLLKLKYGNGANPDYSGLEVYKDDGMNQQLVYNGYVWTVGDAGGVVGTSAFRLLVSGEAAQPSGYVPGYNEDGQLVVSAGFNPTQVSNLNSETPEFAVGVKLGHTTLTSASANEDNFVFPPNAGALDSMLNTDGQGNTTWITRDSIFGQSLTNNSNVNFADLSMTGNLVVAGDLTVSGTTTYVNSADMEVQDNVILLNSGETGAGVSRLFAGLQVKRGTSTDKQFLFNEKGANVTEYWTVGSAGALNSSKFRLAELAVGFPTEWSVPGYDANGRLDASRGFSKAQADNLRLASPSFTSILLTEPVAENVVASSTALTLSASVTVLASWPSGGVATLPSASAAKGKTFTVYYESGSSVSVAPATGDLIAGVSGSLVLDVAGQHVRFLSVGNRTGGGTWLIL